MPPHIKNIIELESEFQVETWQVNGVYIWPLIRICLTTDWALKESRIKSNESNMHTYSLPSGVWRALEKVFFAGRRLYLALLSVPSWSLVPGLITKDTVDRIAIFDDDIDREQTCYGSRADLLWIVFSLF